MQYNSKIVRLEVSDEKKKLWTLKYMCNIKWKTSNFIFKDPYHIYIINYIDGSSSSLVVL